ncbi:T9SS type A sorting domain-containing protein [Chitinophagaceae bacterium MMS25-I14]
MKTHLLLVLLLLIAGNNLMAQTPERLGIISVLPNQPTGQDYTPWMNDDTTLLVADVNSTDNQIYTEITLQLDKKSNLSSLSLYSGNGVFASDYVYLFALSDTGRTFIGSFSGATAGTWTNISISPSVDADAIIIKKYGNNIPQKIKVFGTPEATALQRIRFGTPIPSENTEQDYTPWLSDNIDSMVEAAWQYNFKWVDVKLPLPQKSYISKISYYDWQGVFSPSDQAYIYAKNGNQLQLIDSFTGPGYELWEHIYLSQPVLADTIVVHKYCNNIPQKINLYGYAATVYTAGKIPLDSNRWYQLNNVANGLGGLTNGILNEVVETGWGKVLPQWDSYYPLLDGEEMNIDSIKFFDGQGSNTDQPMTLSVITADWQRIPIATFTGGTYMQWVGPYPDRTYNTGDNSFKLDSTIHNPRYLVLNTYWAYPTEIELYGTYKTPAQASTPYIHKPVRMGQAFGVNAFEWNFEDGANPGIIDEPGMNMVKSFTGIRHYMDWTKLEPGQGSYTFNPCHSGGWNYDTIYARCKTEGIEVLADLKTLPAWMVATYPSDQQDYENVPVPYGSDFTDPASYIAQAKTGFQYAARYGRNTSVPDSLIHIDGTIRWYGDPQNVARKGLDYIKYIECDNERDKWWKGRKGYQTGREYAANLSAFYDGHKHTLGAGVGVKTADSTMQVVMCGLAGPNTDYVRGMIDWCKEFRGYKADGTVNLCWDVINYHMYSNNGNASQGGDATRGAAPEVSQATAAAQKFLQMAHDYAYDMPVWITEAGYDLNQGSPFHAMPIGTKTAEQTQADWILRNSLLYNRMGIERVFFYEMYDDNAQNPTQFASSGLINDNRTRRPVADFLYQTNKLMGQYIYQETINASPLVDHYALDSQDAYVLLMPTENGSTGTYTLNLDNTDSANVYTPTAGQDSMTMTRVAVTGGELTVIVSETPVFVLPVAGNTAQRGVQSSTLPANALSGVSLFPNPAADKLNILLENDDRASVTVNIYDITGRFLKTQTFEKTSTVLNCSINITGMTSGTYLFEIQQGSKKITKRIVKK